MKVIALFCTSRLGDLGKIKYSSSVWFQKSIQKVAASQKQRMENEKDRSSDEDGTFVREIKMGKVGERRSSRELKGEDQRQTSAEFRQRAKILKDSLRRRYQAREELYQDVMSINKVLFFIAALLAFSFVFEIAWIPRVIAAAIMIITGLRYGWLKINGEDAVVIPVPTDS